MSTTTNITTTYAGESANKWVAAALLSAPTLANNLIEIMPNVKYKAVMHKLATTGLLKDASCDFDPTSTVTITERVLTPKQLSVNVQLCKNNFRDTWQAIEMGYSSHDVLPKSFADYLIGYMAEKVAAANETSIWAGDATNTGEFDGFATLLALDANLPSAQEVTGTTLTAANIVAELGKVLDATPQAVYSQPNFRIYISSNAYRLYLRSLGGFGASGLGANGYDNKGNNQELGSLLFDGVPLVVVNGLGADQMIATYKENFTFGTSLLSDEAEVKLLDMSLLDGSDNVRVIMKMAAGVQYSSVEDVTTYGITNSVN